MADPEIDAFIRQATPTELELYLVLIRLQNVLRGLSQGMQEGVLEIVHQMTERENLSPWERAIEELGWE
jgi:hypothetical protein